MFKAIWYWMTRYMVVAQWGDIRKVHWARSEAEAREWMACYKADALIVYGKRGRMLGARWAE